MKKNSFTDAFRTRAFRAGGYSALITLAVTAILVVINLLMSQLPTTVTKLDMSNNDLYSISDATKSIVKQLNTDITIYQIAPTGSESNSITEFIHRYQALNGKIKYEVRDPELYPTFVSQYTTEELSTGSLIVVNNVTGRAKCIDYSSEIFYPDYSGITQELYQMYQMGYDITPYLGTVFAGESAVTSALDYVTSADIPKTYAVTGHGETDLGSGYASLITTDNIDYEALDLKTQTAIPDDADLLIINNPLKDITEDEKTLLEKYLSTGGKLMLVTSYENGELKNLYSVASAYGLNYADGMVIESSSSRYNMYAYALVPKISANSYTEKLPSNAYVLMPMSHGITISSDLNTDQFTITKLLTTSEGAYLKSADEVKTSLKKDDDDPTGEFSLGVVSAKKDGGSVVWFSSPYMTSDSMLSYYYNGQLFISTVDLLCGKTTASVSIAVKTISTDYLTVSSPAKSIWLVMLVILVPASALVSGLVIWNRRRKR